MSALDAHDGLDAELLGALRTIAAWATYELGITSLADGIRTAQDRSHELPPGVERSLATISSLDSDEWTPSLQSDFDPWWTVGELLEHLGDEDRELLAERILPLQDRPTLEEIGKRRGITRERVRQKEQRLVRRLRSASEESGSLQRTCVRLRSEVGVAMRQEQVSRTHTWQSLRVPELQDIRAQLLLWLAGPYELVDEWVVARPAKKTVGETRGAVSALLADGPAPIDAVEEELARMGVTRSEAGDWLPTVGPFRVREGLVVRWGGSMADRAEVALQLSGKPMTRDELAEELGGNINVRSLAGQLYSDPRIKRTGVRHFGLTHWEHDEYTGVADEIAQEIERQGGTSTLGGRQRPCRLQTGPARPKARLR